MTGEGNRSKNFVTRYHSDFGEIFMIAFINPNPLEQFGTNISFLGNTVH